MKYYDQYIPVMQSSTLFEDMTLEEIHKFLSCIHPVKQVYDAGSIIFNLGDHIASVYWIAEGLVDAVLEDFWGNQTILGSFETGHIFADAFVLAKADVLPYFAYARKPTVVYLFDYHRMINVCSSCSAHNSIISNLLAISARGNIGLMRKLKYVTKRSIRDKLMAYLSDQYMIQGTKHLTLMYNRQELANYLAVERSALSAEMSKMQKDGLISYNKSTFELHRLYKS